MYEELSVYHGWYILFQIMKEGKVAYYIDGKDEHLGNWTITTGVYLE